MTARGIGDTDAIAGLLNDRQRRVPALDFPRAADDVNLPGLYAWFVDSGGAEHLSSGLGHRIEAGLIYAGQTGARTGGATLRSRVGRNHIRGNVRGSTFRFTLGAILARPLNLAGAGDRKLADDGELQLSHWIGGHLSVAVAPLEDRLTIRQLESAVLARLDPPLNLEGMPPTPIRAELSRLRSALASAASVPRTTPPERPRTRRAPSRVGSAPDVAAFLAALVGQTIPTMTGRPNKILHVEGDVVWVGTNRSQQGQPVAIAEVQDAANRLFADGEIRIDVPTVGHRSAFVGAVLSALPGTRAELNPRRIVLIGQEDRS
jgi:hypothetical protein